MIVIVMFIFCILSCFLQLEIRFRRKVSADLYGIEIENFYTQAVLISTIYCSFDYLVLADILSAMLCSIFAPCGKKGKCGSPASEASRKFGKHGS